MSFLHFKFAFFVSDGSLAVSVETAANVAFWDLGLLFSL